MTIPADLDCCNAQAELDRLICRMAAHGSYGASAAARARDDGDADDRDDR